MIDTPRTFEEAFREDGQFRDSESNFQNPSEEPEQKFFARWGWHARDEEIEELEAMLSQAKRAFVELTKIQGEGARRIAELEQQVGHDR